MKPFLIPGWPGLLLESWSTSDQSWLRTRLAPLALGLTGWPIFNLGPGPDPCAELSEQFLLIIALP